MDSNLETKLPPLPTENDSWYYVESGKAVGTFSKLEMLDLIKSGRIRSDTYVFKEGTKDWIKAYETELYTSTDTSYNWLKLANIIIWFVAILPWIDSFIYYNTTEEQYTETTGFIFLIFLFTILCWTDKWIIENKLNIDTDRLGFWWLILVPVYLWKRATLLRHKRVYFWVFMLNIIAEVFFYEIFYF